MDKVKKTVWVAVDKDMEFTEHESMDLALSTNPFVIFLEKEGEWENGPYQNYAYDIDFYNFEGYKIDGVILNSWRLSDLKITHGGFSNGFSKSIVILSVIDPLGSFQIRNFGNRRSGIISALVLLNAVCKYDNWEDFRQYDPSEKEKSEIQLLQNEVERLTNENGVLLEKLDKIRQILSAEGTNLIKENNLVDSQADDDNEGSSGD